MARYGQRPENALKRANEFIEVGKPTRALDTLQEVFRNKKWAYNWSESVLEPIMFKYLDLCVELKKSHIAKEGLFQYRNMFQSVNVGSLENVIRGYLRMAEEKTEGAREQSAQAVVDIDDLDNVATPESILLSAVSGEDAQDRSDRTILTPWVKFLWESYCQCLELLRTNAHVETLYHDIARMAFQFCLKYNRKTEFRKLCDKLRKHLEDICKLPAQVANVSISKPETQQLNLETRLYQLESAIQMELWQEAYKAIEDIHGLMNMSKKMPVPKTMANYYQKLAMVFWKAGNYLFHAAALFKLFQLSKEMKKNITPEELQRMACTVLVATLAIPLPSAHPEFDRFIETDKSPLEKAQRLAVLLGLFQPPTRASLLRDAARANVVALATPRLRDLYAWLEVEFHPLHLCERVRSVVRELEEEGGSSALAQYVPALQDVTLVRLIRQVAQVYQTIEFTRLIELAQFTSPFHMERLLVDCVRHNDMQIRIDHKRRCVHFGIDLAESQREDSPEGPSLQSMPSEQIRNQLVNMATVLHQAINVINPNKKKAEREKIRAAMVANYHETKVREHQRILQRRRIIEDRKEYIERLNTVREEEEQRRLEEMARQQAIAEQKRLEQEREERERKRALNEIQQIKDRHLKEKMQQISQTSHGLKILKKLDEDDIKKMDADQIAAREAEELQKERRELQAKLKSQEKKVDYFERAKRLEEIPLLQANMKERQLQDQAFWEQQEQERINTEIEERKLSVATRERLGRMKIDKIAFLEKLMNERNIVYEDEVKKFEKKLSEERKYRLDERKEKRRLERRALYLEAKAEEEERKRAERARLDEEERIRREEQEQKEREEREKAEREERERAAREREEMLERSAAKQRAKEEEIERKLQAEEAARAEAGGGAGGGAPTWRRGGAPAPERVGATEREEGRKPVGGPWRSPRLRESDRVTDGKPMDSERPSEVGSSWRSFSRGDTRDDRGRDDRNRDDRSRDDRYDDRPSKDRYSERREDRSDDRRDDARREDSRREDSRREDSRREDSRREDSRRDDSRRDDFRRDDSRREDTRRDDFRRDDLRRDDLRRDDSRREDSRRDYDRDDRYSKDDRGSSWRGASRAAGGGVGGGIGGGIGGGSDWRTSVGGAKDVRKPADPLGERRLPDDRGRDRERERERERDGRRAVPLRSDAKPRDPQPESEDGWSHVSKRR